MKQRRHVVDDRLLAVNAALGPDGEVRDRVPAEGDQACDLVRVNVVGSQPSKPAIKEKETACLPGTAALPVDYDTHEASHSTMIHGLCETGGFIKTTNAFAIGQELDLTFTDPESGDAFMLSGVVADRKADGIDVKFEDLSEKQIAKLKTAIEHSE